MHATTRHVLVLLAAGTFVAGTFAAASAGDEDGEFPGFEEKVGTSRSDQLRGTAGNDFLRALGGADVVQGYRGMDILRGGNGWDNASGGLRSDDVSGGPGRDVVTGGDAADWVVELGGDDVVNGGGGRDWLALGTGSDSLQAGENGDLVLVLNDRDTDTIQCGDGRDIVVYFYRIDTRDSRRSCERIFTIRDEEVEDESLLPPEPPIIEAEWDGPLSSETSESAHAKRQRAFKQMARELRASIG